MKKPELLSYIPTDILTASFIEYLINKHPKLLAHIPEEHITEDFITNKIKSKPTLLKYLPQKYQTTEFYDVIFNLNYKNINYIPQKYVKESYIDACLNYDITIFNSNSIQLLKEQHYIKILEILKNNLNLKISNKQKEIINTISHNNNTKDSNNITLINLERDLNIRLPYKSFYNADTKLFIVEEKYSTNREHYKIIERSFNDFDSFYLYLNKNLDNVNLIDYNFDNLVLSKYDLNNALISSEIQQKLNKYDNAFYEKFIKQNFDKLNFTPFYTNETTLPNTIQHDVIESSKLNDYFTKYHYISDLHLMHHINESYKYYINPDEVANFIDKTSIKLLDNLKQSHDSIFEHKYLLIAGDVSFDLKVLECFLFCINKHRPFNTKIVFVLGNHELYHTEKNIEKVINNIRTICKKNNIIFLHNELLLDNIDETIIIKEQELQSITATQLREKAINYYTIIFGSLGFTGNNKVYNASTGLYRNTIKTIDEDKALSLKTETVYKKLVEALPNEQLIILTHTPLEDWSNLPYQKNWIYVNGHTHKNKYLSENGITIYADNQIGYKSNQFNVKHFTKTRYIDIFKYYADGIHTISADKYRQHLYSLPCRRTYNRNNEVIMLKRENIYMFLLYNKSNNTYYILDGGVPHCLPNKPQYYFDKMVIYANYIKNGLKLYNQTQKELAKRVKQFGGDGYIHGSIIDIDFFNHIYLDPETGRFIYYYSPSYGYRKEYDSIDLLLKTHNKQLYAKYKQTSNLITQNKHDITHNFEEWQTDKNMYKFSLMVKKLQDIIDLNIIRKWVDNLNFDTDIDEINIQTPVLPDNEKI